MPTSIRLTIACVCMAVWCCLALADEPQKLAYDVPVGHAWRYEDLSTSELTLRIQANGQSFDANQTSSRTMRAEVRVVDVRGGVPSVVEMAFDEGIGTEIVAFGQAQPQESFALAGRSVRIAVPEDGPLDVQPIDDAGPLPLLTDDDLSTLHDLVVPDPDLLPVEAVDVGSKWSTEVDRDDPTSTLELTFEVVRFSTLDGRREVELAVEGTMTQAMDGDELTATLSGTMHLDVQTGLFLRGELGGPVKTKSRVEQEGQVILIEGTGRIDQRTTALLIDGQPRATETETKTEVPMPPAVEGWLTYTDAASGARFQHPASWRVQAGPQGLLVVPEGYDPQREIILASGAEAPGVADATDPAVGEQLDATLRQLVPTLRRATEPTPVEVFGGSGAAYRYAGTMPDGRAAECVALVRVGDGLATGFSMLAAPELLDRRLPTLRRMLGTLHVPAPEAATAGEGVRTDDRRLVGMFGGEAIAGGADAGVYVNTRLVYALGADGVVLYGAQSAMTASARDHTGELEWTATGETSGSVQRGRWSAKEGMLTIAWDDGGRSVFAYGFEPDGSLVLRHPRTRELINFFERIR